MRGDRPHDDGEAEAMSSKAVCTLSSRQVLWMPVVTNIHTMGETQSQNIGGYTSPAAHCPYLPVKA